MTDFYCSCGNTIHPKRVEILQKQGRRLCCINCAENSVQKLVGVQVVSGKTERAIEICQPEQAKIFEKLSARTGVGVSKGVKMDQSFKLKNFKK